MKENMQLSTGLENQKLNREQQDLITDNYEQLCKKIRENTYKYFKKNKSIRNKRFLAEEAISFIPEIVLSWDPEKGKNIGFVNYVANLVVLRMFDEYRKSNKNEHCRSLRAKLIEKISSAKSTESSDEDIISGLLKYVKNPKKYYLKQIPKFVSDSKIMSNNTFNSPKLIPSQENQIEWNEFKTYIISSANKILENDKERDIYISIISDHIIPKSEKKYYKKLQEIANTHKVSSSKIFLMSKDSKMRRIFRELIKKD